MGYKPNEFFTKQKMRTLIPWESVTSGLNMNKLIIKQISAKNITAIYDYPIEKFFKCF